MAKSTSDRDERDEEYFEEDGPDRPSNSAMIALIVFFFTSWIPTLLLFLIKSSRDTPPKNPIPKFLLNDWYFAGPMLTMALVAIALVVWRALLNFNARTDMSGFLPEFQETLQKDGVEGALHMCKMEPGLIPRKLYVAALETSKQGISAQKRAMASVLELEIIPELNFLLAPILAIAKIATMVGLLGTVISMVDTFSSISNAEGGDPTKVTSQAGAIGLALFATALGLMTAIPLVFAHVLFKDWITRFETKMKAAAQRLIILFQTIKPKQGEAKKVQRKAVVRENEPQRQRSDSRAL